MWQSKKFTVKARMSCQSQNIIYVISCPGCNEFYIEETGSTVRSRVRVYKQQIDKREYRKIKLSEHLDNCGNFFFTFPFTNYLQTKK